VVDSGDRSTLLHHLPLPSRDEVRRLAQALGGFIAALSQVPRAAVKDLVPVEQPALDDYRDEAAELSRALHPELGAAQRKAVASFLIADLPPSPVSAGRDGVAAAGVWRTAARMVGAPVPAAGAMKARSTSLPAVVRSTRSGPPSTWSPTGVRTVSVRAARQMGT
jgi:hypothetical protein